MKALHKLAALFLSVLITGSALGQALKAQPSSSEDTRIARLVGLAKVWGTVKYFHPYLAYRDVELVDGRDEILDAAIKFLQSKKAAN